MSVERRARAEDVVGLGIALAAGGLYFVLAGLGLLPLPERGAAAPAFVIVGAGAAFLFAGGAVALRARAGAREARSNWPLPSCRTGAVAIAATLALIGVFAAIGSGPGPVAAANSPAGEAPFGETVGRAVFALGAVVVWIAAIALTVGAVRLWLDRGRR